MTDISQVEVRLWRIVTKTSCQIDCYSYPGRQLTWLQTENAVNRLAGGWEGGVTPDPGEISFIEGLIILTLLTLTSTLGEHYKISVCCLLLLSSSCLARLTLQPLLVPTSYQASPEFSVWSAQIIINWVFHLFLKMIYFFFGIFNGQYRGFTITVWRSNNISS